MPRLRMRGAITSLPSTPPCRGDWLKKARGQIYLHLLPLVVTCDVLLFFFLL